MDYQGITTDNFTQIRLPPRWQTVIKKAED